MEIPNEVITLKEGDEMISIGLKKELGVEVMSSSDMPAGWLVTSVGSQRGGTCSPRSVWCGGNVTAGMSAKSPFSCKVRTPSW